MHFDPKINIVVTSDARDLRIRAVILHKYDDGTTKSIMHASRSLIAAEKNYSQIEKKALVIFFPCKSSINFYIMRISLTNPPSSTIVYIWFKEGYSYTFF